MSRISIAIRDRRLRNTAAISNSHVSAVLDCDLRTLVAMASIGHNDLSGKSEAREQRDTEAFLGLAPTLATSPVACPVLSHQLLVD
jgi:hypothetical protein